MTSRKFLGAGRWLVVIVWAFPLIASAEETTIAQPARLGVYAIIDAIVASPPRNRGAVERIIGTELTLSAADAFNFYEASNVTLADMTLRYIDYREPGRDEHEQGPLLALTVEGRCLTLNDILDRYGYDGVESPSVHGVDELRYWVRHQRWGELSFGFAPAENCLKQIIMDIRPES